MIRRMQRQFGLYLSATTALAQVGLGALQAAEDVRPNPKGVYLSGTKPGVKFDILLEREEPRVVATTHSFRTGDRFRLRLELNRAGYVYVLNRTLIGNPDELRMKDIMVLREEDRRTHTRTDSANAYRLVYPAQGSAAVYLAGHHSDSVPIDRSFFVMDDNIGVEKLLIVVSSKPIDVRHFNPNSGHLRAPNPLTPPSPAGKASTVVDHEDDVIARLRIFQHPPAGHETADHSHGRQNRKTLNDELASFAENTDDTIKRIRIPTRDATKGVQIVDEPSGYGIAQDPSRPMMVEISLSHYER